MEPSQENRMKEIDLEPGDKVEYLVHENIHIEFTLLTINNGWSGSLAVVERTFSTVLKTFDQNKTENSPVKVGNLTTIDTSGNFVVKLKAILCRINESTPLDVMAGMIKALFEARTKLDTPGFTTFTMDLHILQHLKNLPSFLEIFSFVVQGCTQPRCTPKEKYTKCAINSLKHGPMFVYVELKRADTHTFPYISFIFSKTEPLSSELEGIEVAIIYKEKEIKHLKYLDSLDNIHRIGDLPNYFIQDTSFKSVFGIFSILQQQCMRGSEDSKIFQIDGMIYSVVYNVCSLCTDNFDAAKEAIISLLDDFIKDITFSNVQNIKSIENIIKWRHENNLQSSKDDEYSVIGGFTADDGTNLFETCSIAEKTKAIHGLSRFLCNAEAEPTSAEVNFEKNQVRITFSKIHGRERQSKIIWQTKPGNKWVFKITTPEITPEQYLESYDVEAGLNDAASPPGGFHAN